MKNLFIIISLIVLLALAAAALAINKRQVEASNFVECKDAGGEISDGITPTCAINGKTFENNGDNADDQKKASADTEIGKEYIGLSEKDAMEKAKQDKRASRVVKRDGKDLMITMDLRQGRLNFTVEDGVVTGVEEEAPKAD